MYTLHLAATRSTPAIHFDPNAGHCTIQGMSIPENAVEFYQPLIHWIEMLLKSSKRPVVLRIDLSYFNSSSLKALYQIMVRLRDAQLTGTNVRVVWVVEDEDEYMLESGNYFNELLGLAVEMEHIYTDGRDAFRRAS